MKLTEAQHRFLSVIETSDGFLECRHADMRTHTALLRRGLIALTYNDGKPDSYRNGYVTTPAGRSALEQSQSQEGK